MEIDERMVAAGELVGDARRLRILVALVDGGARPAGELARAAGVRPSTASHHLELLAAGGLLEVVAQGRHRYYRLAGPQVATWLEQLAALAPPGPVRSLRGGAEREALRFARTCYDHLAGRLGCAWTEAWIARGDVQTIEDGCMLTEAGAKQLIALGVGLHAAPGTVLPIHAVDWTERRAHFAGPIAKAMTSRLRELGWIAHGPTRRAVRVTPLGRRRFSEFGVVLPADASTSPPA